MFDPTSQMANETIFAQIRSNDPQQVKMAEETLTSYTRLKVREDGLLRKILPPITATKFDRQHDTELPVIVVDREPDSPPAQIMPFGTLTPTRYVRGDRYRIMMQRIQTRRFRKEVMELLTWNMDLREVVNSNSLKEILAVEDGILFGTTNGIIGAAGSTVPDINAVMHQNIAGGVTRDTWADAMKVMPSTDYHLQPAKVIVNDITIWDIVKWGRDEAGGDLSQELVLNGWAERVIMGKPVIVTIKHDLVPTDTMYMFAEPKFLGKFVIAEDVTLHLSREIPFIIEWYNYESIGAAIGNIAGVARVNFTP